IPTPIQRPARFAADLELRRPDGDQDVRRPADRQFPRRHLAAAVPRHDLEDSVTMSDLVNHPPHYTAHPSGVECITITEHMSLNVGNAVKYLWRADEKGNALEDLMKAAWYVNREIARRQKADVVDAVIVEESAG